MANCTGRARPVRADLRAAVRSLRGDWSTLLHVFDAGGEGNLYERLAVLQRWLDGHLQARIVYPATAGTGFAQVQTFLRQVEAGGGEG